MPSALPGAMIGPSSEEGPMKVADLMTGDVVTATPEMPLKAAARLLAKRGVSGMPVIDDERHVLGVLSEADVLAKEVDGRRQSNVLLRFLEGPPADDRFDALTVGEAMTAPAIVIDPQRPVTEVATLLLAEGVNRLPVVADGVLVGIVTRADLVRAFARDDEAIRDEIIRTARDDLWVDPTRLDVRVTDGVVQLGGELDSPDEARVVATFARRVPGVVEVVSSVTARG
jgi:CBS domain-containing protein